MRGYVVPQSVVAGRPVTINGTSYAVGVTVPFAALASVRHLDALLSNGTLRPLPDPHRRRTGSKPPHTPTSTGARVRKAITP